MALSDHVRASCIMWDAVEPYLPDDVRLRCSRIAVGVRHLMHVDADLRRALMHGCPVEPNGWREGPAAMAIVAAIAKAEEARALLDAELFGILEAAGVTAESVKTAKCFTYLTRLNVGGKRVASLSSSSSAKG